MKNRRKMTQNMEKMMSHIKPQYRKYTNYGLPRIHYYGRI